MSLMLLKCGMVTGICENELKSLGRTSPSLRGLREKGEHMLCLTILAFTLSQFSFYFKVKYFFDSHGCLC